MTDFLKDMEQSTVADAARSAQQPVVQPVPVSDWFAWRKRHPDIGIGKTGEDGSLEDWRSLLKSEGEVKLSAAVAKARSAGRQGERVWMAGVLAALQVNPSQDSAAKASEGRIDAGAAKMDLLIWCVAHSPICYADARCQWRDGDGIVERSLRTPYGGTITTRTQERICVQGTTVWEKVRDRCAAAQAFIYAELGLEICNRVKPHVYHTLKSDPRWTAYLRAQKLIA